MFNEKIISEMLHYMKANKKTISRDIQWVLDEANKLCPFSHGKKTDPSCYLTSPEIESLISYINRYALCYEFLDINIYDLKLIKQRITNIVRPEYNTTIKEFKENLLSLLSLIEINEKSINNKILRLTCEESIRLDEALNTYSINAFYSCVIMAVSAVESRFHHLIKKKSKTLYKQHFEKATLGQIIQLFDENNSYKDKKFEPLKKVLPRKYKSLVNVLNYYRIFSAHPKSTELTFKTAQSILNFSFNFLLDDETIIDSRLTKCK